VGVGVVDGPVLGVVGCVLASPPQFTTTARTAIVAIAKRREFVMVMGG
jgi:hypothetical protein